MFDSRFDAARDEELTLLGDGRAELPGEIEHRHSAVSERGHQAAVGGVEQRGGGDRT